MQAVMRTYSGKGAAELFAFLTRNKKGIEQEFRKIKGFVSYVMVSTGEGGVTVTVCKTKTAANKSSAVARDWLTKNASDMKFRPPKVAEGKVLIHAV